MGVGVNDAGEGEGAHCLEEVIAGDEAGQGMGAVARSGRGLLKVLEKKKREKGRENWHECNYT